MLKESKLIAALGNPVVYRKRIRRLRRRLRPASAVPETEAAAVLEPVRRAAVVVAHPDDETFCSGLLCELVARGAEVRLLCLTRGEGGPTGGHPRSELGAVREGEMRAACEVLGLSPPEFLGCVDPLATAHRTYAPAISVQALATRLASRLEGCNLVLSHGSCGEYWHPAHLLVNAAVGRLARARRGFDWLTFLAWDPSHPIPRLVNWDDSVSFVFDAAPWQERRAEAFACHRTQAEVFAKFAGGPGEDFIAKTVRESYARPLAKR